MSNEKRVQQIRDAARYKYPDERIHFIDGAKWADSHPQWIPVEERLPEKEEDNPSLSVNVVVTDGNSWFESYYNFNLHVWAGAHLYGSITHWMEIVPPRKEG